MKVKPARGGKQWMVVALVAFVVMFSAVLMFGYNPFQDNLGTISSPDPVIARWDSMPVTWLLNPSTPSTNVSNTGCSDTLANCIQQAIANGFTTWDGALVASQSLTSLTTQYDGTSSVAAPAIDCQNVIGFSDTSSSDFPTGTIAFTQVATVTRPTGTTGSFQYQCGSGATTVTKTCSLDDCIGDADIEFNPGISFTTASTLPANTFSIQSVATHEEGHLLGLSHSGIAHAVMFPFGDSTSAGQQLHLSTDDAIGISFLYPSSNFSTVTGVISGKVTLNGAGVFAAHVVAVDAGTGDAVVDGLTAPDGSYSLVGVPPGTYRILALPLAPNSDTGVLTLDNFSGWDCGFADSTCTTIPQNPTSYTGRYH